MYQQSEIARTRNILKISEEKSGENVRLEILRRIHKGVTVVFEGELTEEDGKKRRVAIKCPIVPELMWKLEEIREMLAGLIGKQLEEIQGKLDELIQQLYEKKNEEEDDFDLNLELEELEKFREQIEEGNRQFNSEEELEQFRTVIDKKLEKICVDFQNYTQEFKNFYFSESQSIFYEHVIGQKLSNHWKNNPGIFKEERPFLPFLGFFRGRERIVGLEREEIKKDFPLQDCTPYFFVSEMCEGTLAEKIEWNSDEVEKAFRATVTALRCMHSLGIMHKDIKSENIFRKDGNFLVSDFGLSDGERKSKAINDNYLPNSMSFSHDAYAAARCFLSLGKNYSWVESQLKKYGVFFLETSKKYGKWKSVLYAIVWKKHLIMSLLSGMYFLTGDFETDDILWLLDNPNHFPSKNSLVKLPLYYTSVDLVPFPTPSVLEVKCPEKKELEPLAALPPEKPYTENFFTRKRVGRGNERKVDIYDFNGNHAGRYNLKKDYQQIEEVKQRLIEERQVLVDAYENSVKKRNDSIKFNKENSWHAKATKEVHGHPVQFTLQTEEEMETLENLVRAENENEATKIRETNESKRRTAYIKDSIEILVTQSLIRLAQYGIDRIRGVSPRIRKMDLVKSFFTGAVEVATGSVLSIVHIQPGISEGTKLAIRIFQQFTQGFSIFQSAIHASSWKKAFFVTASILLQLYITGKIQTPEDRTTRILMTVIQIITIRESFQFLNKKCLDLLDKMDEKKHKN